MPFGLGFPEMAIILGLGVLIFGPKKLPELGNSIGKALKGFKDGMNELEGKSTPATPPSGDLSKANDAPAPKTPSENQS